MGTQHTFISIDEYIKHQPADTQKPLLELRAIIHHAAPNAIELINYNIPAFALLDGGTREQQIMMAGYKHHVGLYPHPTTIEHFATELAQYKCGTGSVQFPIGQPLPKQLIMRMIRYRVGIITKLSCCNGD